MTSPEQLNPDFRDLLRIFQECEVDYILVGAYALALHGLPRATGDLDVLVRPSAENATRVMSALRSFGAPIDGLGIEEKDFSTPDMVVQIGVPPRRIDLLTGISGVRFEEAWSTRIQSVIDDVSVSYLSRDAMLQNKRATGRAKDLADIERLEDADSD